MPDAWRDSLERDCRYEWFQTTPVTGGQLKGGRLFASNPQATYGLSLLRRIASSRAFLTLSRSLACGRPTLAE